ncbi:MAG: HD domain-containing phosphohydrolase [Capsulimonadaceae bacterium]
MSSHESRGKGRWFKRRFESLDGTTRARPRSTGGSTMTSLLDRWVDASPQSAGAAYRRMFETAAEGMYQTSPDGRYLRANPALARIYGYDSPDSLIDGMRDIARELYVDPARRDQLTSMLASTGVIANVESQVYRRDGSAIWISESMRAQKDGTGRILYYSGAVQDITLRRALQDERDRMLVEAVERSERDPLTGLWNHRAFHKRLHEWAARTVDDGVPFAVIVVDVDNFKFFNDAYGHLAGDAVLQQISDRVRDAIGEADVAARYGGDEFTALVLPAIDGTLDDAMAGVVAGMGGIEFTPPHARVPIPVHVSVGAAAYPSEAADIVTALAIADTRMLRSKGGQDEEAEPAAGSSSGLSMLDSLVTAVHNKDRYTRGHSEQVRTYCMQIAHEMGLDSEALDHLKTAALLHDVGNIGIPDSILRKPGSLTDSEREMVRMHPAMGAAIVGSVPELACMLGAIRHHHERWDGSGYPDGLRGERIPRLARIIAVADAYSAMTSDRPYRKALGPAAALAVLEEGAGSQWDPSIVAAFVRARAGVQGR